jgi:crotonobetainyl-CoA:carnitine CoA-transferase CaiB-like acyl-CoA transferase
MVMDVDHPGYGIVRMLGFPIKFSGLPCQVRRPAPRLGEHSLEVLAELGFPQADLEAWQRDGVI